MKFLLTLVDVYSNGVYYFRILYNFSKNYFHRLIFRNGSI